MHGPWHMPEHPDEQDNSEAEYAAEQSRLEAFLSGDCPNIDELEEH